MSLHYLLWSQFYLKKLYLSILIIHEEYYLLGHEKNYRKNFNHILFKKFGKILSFLLLQLMRWVLIDKVIKSMSMLLL